MSTGISISSINRIKELAEEKKFAEALEILDTQNLDKSINPQFLRISGEIFRENKRYYDCRRILLKAHKMSPQGNRIIFELILLYLELGYFSKAEKYYEQYMLNATAEDTQKDFVEYVYKKAVGTEIEELASILIPVLENNPEDKWNYEAMLLYDKLDRKDKALEEARYILENYKESRYTDNVIKYIDGDLNVNDCFYIYPMKEQEEDRDVFGDLIEEEEQILQADYLRINPPEARIMVEADDNDVYEPKQKTEKPQKEKKSRKRRKKKKEEVSDAEEVKNAESADDSDNKDAALADDNKSEDKKDVEAAKELKEDKKAEEAKVEEEKKALEEAKAEEEKKAEEQKREEEELLKKSRKEALDKLLERTVDEEVALQAAKEAVKETTSPDKKLENAKEQVKNVAGIVKDNVKDNVKKASDALGALGNAVGVSPSDEKVEDKNAEPEILDGIIESVLEPPKKTTGQVITNEELDSLIPDSLEAMSESEIADIEARKEERERLELEALAANLKIEEEKKQARAKLKKNLKVISGNLSTSEESVEVEVDSNLKPEDEWVFTTSDTTFNDLKAKFLAEMEAEKEREEAPDSLGFISVVQSDVDSKLEEAMPDEAGMLHRMIDNREFYKGEDSNGFETEESYENHGFEIVDFAFDEIESEHKDDDLFEQTFTDGPGVRLIYADEAYVDEWDDDIWISEKEVVPSEEFFENSTTVNMFDHEEEAHEKFDIEAGRLLNAFDEEAKKLAEEEEAHKRFEEEVRRAEALKEEARRKAEEEAEAKRKAEEEAEAKRKAEEEAEAKRKAEEEARRKAEEEAEAKRKAEEEARRKAEEEAEAKRKEEEARRKAEEEARRKAEEEAEAKRIAEEEARRKAEEEEARKIAEEIEKERLRQEEEQAEIRRMTEEIAERANLERRNDLRVRIILSSDMIQKLSDLKEDR